MRLWTTLLATALLAGCGPKDEDEDGWDETIDCDETRDSVHPGAAEVCNGLDDDCDGEVDEDPIDGLVFHLDGDGDGYGDPWETTEACEVPSGYVDDDTDCDDADDAWHPGAPEEDCTDPNDYNCDGSVGYADADGDGYPACEDCNDGDRAVNPDALEVCDGVDNDCSGVTDGADALDAATWYLDGDGDGYGTAADTTRDCDAPPDGYTDNDEDCNDLSATAYPGADEVCNGEDDDCDFDVDEDAVDATTWYQDIDGDGYGGDRYSVDACEAPAGHVEDSTDCDDLDDETWPGADETCDGDDDDCDGTVDEDAVDPATWYADSDGDGYGDVDTSTESCDAPTGYVADATDCDDGDDASYPGADEVCDEADNDCDGTTDEDDATDAATWYADFDEDGYGDDRYTDVGCDAPSGYVDNDWDCDDLDDTVWGGLGDDATDPASSCRALLACDSSATDGMVHLDPDYDGTTLSAYCDMTEDGGGWTLLAWTGDSSSSPYGVPYPGLAYCEDLDCDRGSALEVDDLEALFDQSSEFAQAQSPDTTMSTYGLIADYDYAGSFDYGSLEGLTLDYGSDSCDTGGFASGTFHTLTGPTTYDGDAVYLAPELRYGSYTHSESATYGYIWNVGAPWDYCNGSGDMPGSWMGTWDAYQYGPYDAYEWGAYSVWVR